MRTGRRLGAVSLVLVALLGPALAGCSAFSSESGVDDERWRAQADAVCIEAHRTMRVDPPVTGAGNPAVAVRARADVVHEQVEGIDELGGPKTQREEAGDLVDALNDQADALDRLADALLDDPSASTGPLAAGVTVANDRVAQLSNELGLPSCAAFATGQPMPGEGTTDSTAGDTGPVDEGPVDEGPVDETPEPGAGVDQG